LLLAVIIANSPDLDLVPGILLGEPNRYHHVGFSHSAVFAAVAALAVGVVAASAGRRWPVVNRRLSAVTGTALMVGLLLLSHILLDALTTDTRPPAGVPMFWPLTNMPVQIYEWFPYVAKMGGEGGPMEFVASVLNAHNIWAMAWEFLTLAPIVVLVAWWRRARADNRRSLDEEAVTS
jgi:membrane-bound metal-dependent hydrolase YbcI (DUF457 family)